MPAKTAHVTEPCSIRIQSILFKNDRRHVDHALESTARAIELAFREGSIHTAEIAIGDCSPLPIFTPEMIAERERRHQDQGIRRIEYQFFDANLGSAAGHNRLLGAAGTDLVMIQNPDVVVAPNLIIEMIAPLRRPGVGQVEARQVPLEHPKDYDASTGETGWASTACSLIPRALLAQLDGFDARTFFLYCDDVDLSWRIRLTGHRVVFQPSAAVFHDKRLSPDGVWMAGAAEQYYSAEAALLLAHKYSRPDLVKTLLRDFDASGIDALARAAAEYRRRAETNQLPTPLDPDHRVGQFVDGVYTPHRW